ncbi:MAG: hypothetical protein CMI36_01965 [Owenweeksia sp.]|nr:hypothetical protein [Owenweeksia sp.]MBF97731.1 hypothetical protein [Owenweeksia sp.]HCQ16876.1 hypothetical protein [Cryomorphaceae bacterium]
MTNINLPYIKRSSAACIGTLLLLVSTISTKAGDCDCLAIPDELRSYVRAETMEGLYEGTHKLAELTLQYKDSKKDENKWIVYSDRANNPIYSKPDTTSINKSTLDFMQKLYVTGIVENSNNWLKVSSVKRIGNREECTELGFIHARNLILNSHAQLNSFSTTKKALVLIKVETNSQLKALESALDRNDGKELETYQFYAVPRVDKHYKREVETALEIRFVLKEQDGMQLLSKSDILDNTISIRQINQDVSGWMPNTKLTPWDTRYCYEIVHDDFNIYDQKRNPDGYKSEEPIPVFMNQNYLNEYTRGHTDVLQKAVAKYTIKKERPPILQMRMPVLQYNRELPNVKVAVMGSQGVMTGETEIVKIEETLDENSKLKQNVNILFVVDATHSMEPYKQSVIKGLEQIMELRNKFYKDKKINYGVVLYRDKEDNEGEYEIFQPLAINGPQDIAKVSGFVENSEFDSKGKTRFESQYYGLIRGMEDCNFSKEESNIVILIGDAANYRQDPRGLQMKDVVNALNQHHASLIAFQVYYGDDPSYLYFNRDANQYIRSMANSRKEKDKLKPLFKELQDRKNAWVIQFQDEQTGIQQDFVTSGFGRYIFADSNSEMPFTELESNLVEAMDDYFRAMEQQTTVRQTVVKEGKVEVPDHFVQAEVNAMKLMLEEYGFSSDKIEQFFNKVKEYAMIGYTSKSFYGKKECFTPVIFLTHTEVSNIMRQFRKFDPDATDLKARKQFYDNLKTMTMNALGEQNEEVVNTKTLDELWTVVFGFPFDLDRHYGDLHAEKLGNIEKSKHSKLDDFISQFNKSIPRFSMNNLMEDQFKMHNSIYYWVQLDKFPGNAN